MATPESQASSNWSPHIVHHPDVHNEEQAVGDLGTAVYGVLESFAEYIVLYNGCSSSVAMLVDEVHAKEM